MPRVELGPFNPRPSELADRLNPGPDLHTIGSSNGISNEIPWAEDLQYRTAQGKSNNKQTDK